MRFGGLAACLEFGLPGLVVEDEVLHETAGLDILQHPLHLRLGLVRDDTRAGLDVAIFGRVADRIAHVGDAAFVQQVDDQLGFVQAFEIRHLGRISRFHQRFETRLDQVRDPAAQYRLLTEQIGFAFFLEVGFDDARTPAAHGTGIGQGELLGITLAARLLAFLVDRDQARHAAALDVFAAHGVTRALGRDHDHVDVGRGIDQAEMDVEPVGEGQRAARLHLACHLVGVDCGLMLVRGKDHQHIGPFGGLGYRLHRESCAHRLFRRRRSFAQRDDDFADTAVTQVLRMGVPLAAIAHNGDLLVLDQVGVAIGIVINLHWIPLENFGVSPVQDRASCPRSRNDRPRRGRVRA